MMNTKHNRKILKILIGNEVRWKNILLIDVINFHIFCILSIPDYLLSLIDLQVELDNKFTSMYVSKCVV